MKTTHAVQTLSALAQESRLALYRLLVERGPQGLSAGTISEQLGIAPATLSFHLKELLNVGLIKASPQGRFIIYSAHYPAMDQLLSFLTRNCCGGNPCSGLAAKGKSQLYT